MMRRKQENPSSKQNVYSFSLWAVLILHRTKKRKAMSDKEKLERRKKLKEEHELPSSLAEAANSSSNSPPSDRPRQSMRAQAL
jgi:hypothetical protein